MSLKTTVITVGSHSMLQASSSKAGGGGGGGLGTFHLLTAAALAFAVGYLI